MRARVVSVHSGAEYADGRRRVTLRFADADSMNNTLRIMNDVLELDEVVHFYMEAAVTA